MNGLTAEKSYVNNFVKRRESLNFAWKLVGHIHSKLLLLNRSKILIFPTVCSLRSSLSKYTLKGRTCRKRQSFLPSSDGVGSFLPSFNKQLQTSILFSQCQRAQIPSYFARLLRLLELKAFLKKAFEKLASHQDDRFNVFYISLFSSTQCCSRILIGSFLLNEIGQWSSVLDYETSEIFLKTYVVEWSHFFQISPKWLPSSKYLLW